MEQERIVLCGASAYEQKYYFNKLFDKIPQSIQDELHIICVLFTEEVGGIITFAFEPDGTLVIETDAAENIKVTKAKSKEKIDGIVASIMALDRCLRNQGEPQGSVYDERGLLVF